MARAKFLRGTIFDLFGWAEVRREERRLAGEFVAAIDRILPRLSETNLKAAIELAELPDRVRGYESLKQERIRSYRAALQQAETEIRGADGR